MRNTLMVQHPSGLINWRQGRRIQLMLAVQSALLHTYGVAAYQMQRSVEQLEQEMLQAERAGQMTPQKRDEYLVRLEAHLIWLQQRVAQAHWEIQTILSQ